MPIMTNRSAFLSIALIVAGAWMAGCDREAGYTVTHDGRWVSATPEVAAEDFAWHLGKRAADGAGKDWKATATIAEKPVIHQVKADEYGWKTMTVTVTLVPPRGPTPTGEILTVAKAKAESAIYDAAKYRVSRTSDIHLNTTITEAGAPLPGSQSYTTVAGDTWVAISTAYYGSAQHWRMIADANPGIDGAHMPAGTVLVIPPKP